MDKLMAIVRREYMERVRTRWFLIATVFGPVLFGVLMFLPAIIASKQSATDDVRRVVILDATGTDLGRRVARGLNGGVFGDTAVTRVEVVSPGGMAAAESLATRAVQDERAKGYLVLDSATVGGFSARYAGSNTTAMIDMNRLERTVRRQVLGLRLEREGLAPERAEAVTDVSLEMKTERLTKRGRGGSAEVSLFFALGVAMLLYFSITLYGMNVMRGVIEEKSSRVAEIVVSSVTPARLLAGKVIGVGAVGLTQVLLWIAGALALNAARTPLLRAMGITAAPFELPAVSWGTGALLVAFFVLGFTFYAAAFAAVGAMVDNEQEAQQAQTPVVLLLISSVVFLQNILLAPDGTLARVMGMLPFSAPIVMPLRLASAPVPAAQVGGALASVTVGAVLVTWLAARIYRVGILMYGKRPTLAELVRWVRQ
ncbi:MAG: ABC transporter permease [Gemmatimonadaceae bacterium]|nr:ABC transporter permease [Gemmatimonadaceae bacterium]